MKTKWDKIQKEPLKKDNKQVAKIASPKNKPNQGLGSYKSEKDLNRKSIKPE